MVLLKIRSIASLRCQVVISSSNHHTKSSHKNGHRNHSENSNYRRILCQALSSLALRRIRSVSSRCLVGESR